MTGVGIERIPENIETVQRRIMEACRRAGRSPGDVRLVAVTKLVQIEGVIRAFDAGVRDFGENYAKELAEKADRLPQARWHFLGKLQRGTAARVAEHAAVVHSAEPGEGLGRLALRAARTGRSVECLVQVDFTGRRHGVAPEDVGSFVETLRSTDGLEVAGLMTLPPPEGSPEAERPYFRRLRDLRDSLASRWPEVRELSMGMSASYAVAVEEGATMVRVGTALFGERPAE
jgi:pyridoxal phosphate enzyme (YggS family)